jgi:YVTN family beta-propeller protein
MFSDSFPAPSGASISPDGGTLYVANYGYDNITLIDTATNTIGVIIPVATSPEYVVVTPDQAPLASFTFVAALSGSATQFDASSSLSPVGTIANYAWDFGDGSCIEETTNPTISHTYASDGFYTVILTVTNSGGTSTSQVFTGRTMTRNGGPTATFSQLVQIGNPTPPSPPSPPTPFIPFILPLPPYDFQGQAVLTQRFPYPEHANWLTWKPSLDLTVVNYQLFRNEELIAIIPQNGPYFFVDRHRKKHKRNNYVLVAVSIQGVRSQPVSITLP